MTSVTILGARGVNGRVQLVDSQLRTAPGCCGVLGEHSVVHVESIDLSQEVSWPDQNLSFAAYVEFVKTSLCPEYPERGQWGLHPKTQDEIDLCKGFHKGDRGQTPTGAFDLQMHRIQKTHKIATTIIWWIKEHLLGWERGFILKGTSRTPECVLFRNPFGRGYYYGGVWQYVVGNTLVGAALLEQGFYTRNDDGQEALWGDHENGSQGVVVDMYRARGIGSWLKYQILKRRAEYTEVEMKVGDVSERVLLRDYQEHQGQIYAALKGGRVVITKVSENRRP